jgi:hypothetical protein
MTEETKTEIMGVPCSESIAYIVSDTKTKPQARYVMVQNKGTFPAAFRLGQNQSGFLLHL